jgi:hypothetical protein
VGEEVAPGHVVAEGLGQGVQSPAGGQRVTPGLRPLVVDQSEYPTQGRRPDLATDNTTSARRSVTADRRR